MCTHKLRRGFTLIEVLVVIGILAILAGVVLVAINPNRQFQQARDSQRVSNTAAILNAVGQYMVDHKGELPGGIDTTKKDISNTGANICKDLVPTYLPALPSDPKSTHKGGALIETDCDTGDTYDLDYAIAKDANGRITVSATPETPGADPISITR